MNVGGLKSVASAILADVEPGFQPGGQSPATEKSLVKLGRHRHTNNVSGRQDAALYGRPGGPPPLFKPALIIFVVGLVSLGLLPAALAVPNDTCTGAEVIPAAGPFPYYTAVTPDITGATTTNDPPTPSSACTQNIVSRSIWYQFTPPTTRLYTISAAADTATTVQDTVMGIYTSSGGCAGPFNEFACSDDEGGLQSAISSTLNSGTTYYIVVWVSGASAPLGTNTAVQLRVSQPAIPSNDTCAGAEVIPAAGPFPYLTGAADNTLAATSGDPPNPSCHATVSRSVWYRLTPDTSETYNLATCPGTATTVYDTVMAIYSSTNGCNGPFVPVACNDNACEFRSTITASLNAGATYYIVVWEGDNEPYTSGETTIQVRVSKLRPQFTFHQRLANGNFRLQFTGAAGQSYGVQASTNLTSWPSIGVASDLGNGLFEFIDTSANSYATRFYRIVTPAN